MKITSFSVEGFKCFDRGSGKIEVGSLNILVGKNNSGKSSIVQALQYIFEPPKFKAGTPQLLALRRNGIDKPMYARFEVAFSKEQLRPCFPAGHGTGPFREWDDIGVHLVDQPVTVVLDLEARIMGSAGYRKIELSDALWRKIDQGPKHRDTAEKILNPGIERAWQTEFDRWGALIVPSAREIAPNPGGDPKQIAANGNNLGLVFESHLTSEWQDHLLVERDLKKELVELFPALTNDLKIRTTKTAQGWVQIHLQEPGKPSLPIHNYGGGISNIIVLISQFLLVKRHKKKLIFLLEEPENSLHPELQRKFSLFLRRHFSGSDDIAFVTTHSPSFIDWSGAAKVALVSPVDGASVIKSLTAEDIRLVTNELGFLASHVLQADVLLLVEGPSDSEALTILLEKVGINVLARNISVLPLGGDNIRRLDPAGLSRINRNVLVFMDSDRLHENDSANPAEWKKEFQRSCTAAGIPCIIPAEFRTLENILPVAAFRRTFGNQEIAFGPYDKVPDKVKDYSKKHHTRRVAAEVSVEEAQAIPPLMELKRKLLELLPKQL